MVSITGVGVIRPEDPTELSLEELVFAASAAALADAGLERADIDGVTLAASDQLDGRAISSMHLAGPAGAYLRDEVKVTDDGACALALTALRIEAGMSSRVLTVSWTKPSASAYEPAIGVNAEPTYARPVGLHPLVVEAIATRQFLEAHGLGRDDIAALESAQGVNGGTGDEVVSLPLRRRHLPPPTEGAVALVVTADAGDVSLGGLAWGADDPDPLRRGGPLGSLPRLAREAYAQAGIEASPDLVVETTDRTLFRLPMAAAGLGLVDAEDAFRALSDKKLANLNRSGGLRVSNPVVAAGLERIAEAVGLVRGGEDVAVAHSSYGMGGQGNLVAVLRRG